MNNFVRRFIWVGCIYLGMSPVFGAIVTKSEAKNQGTTASTSLKKFFHDYYANGIYSYRTFHFDSSRENNFNRYRGHTALYGLGANNIHFNDSISAGLFLFQSFTNVSAQVSIGVPPVLLARQSLQNNNLYGHILKRVTDTFYLDASGGISQMHTKVHNELLNPDGIENGFSSAKGRNWFAMLSAYLAQVKGSFIFREDLRLMNSYVSQDSYLIHYAPTGQFQDVPFFSNRSTFSMETIELTYAKSTMWQPYVNAGLIQVLQFKNNTVFAPAIVLGPFPEFNLDQNGYMFGGGLSWNNEPVVVRLDYQFTQRGSVFQSNQVTLMLRIKMD